MRRSVAPKRIELIDENGDGVFGRRSICNESAPGTFARRFPFRQARSVGRVPFSERKRPAQMRRSHLEGKIARDE
jgi:hypothetical protein